jgi:hypothetical protein
MNIDFNAPAQTVLTVVTQASMKIVCAAVPWFVGRWLI